VVPLVVAARKLGIDPTVYVNERNDWGPTKAAFDAAGVAHPHWWVANYDGREDYIPSGAVARQYANEPMVGFHADASAVIDHWPGVDGTFGNPSKTEQGGFLVGLSNDEQIEIRDKVRALYTAVWGPSKDAPIVGGGPGTPETIQDTVQRVAAAQQRQIEADRIDDKVFADTATAVDRIDKRGASGGLSGTDLTALATQIADQVEGATVQQIANALEQVRGSVTFRQVPSGG